jgi:hypothetical protein
MPAAGMVPGTATSSTTLVELMLLFFSVVTDFLAMPLLVAYGAHFVESAGALLTACVDALVPFAGAQVAQGVMAAGMINIVRKVTRPETTIVETTENLLHELAQVNMQIGNLESEVAIAGNTQDTMNQLKVRAEMLLAQLNEQAVMSGSPREKIMGIHQVVGNAAITSYRFSPAGLITGVDMWRQSLEIAGINRPLITYIDENLANKNYVCSYSCYDKELVEGHGRGIARAGFTTFILAPLPKGIKNTASLINISESFGLASDSTGENIARVWAEQIPTEHGIFCMVYYEAIKCSDATLLQNAVVRVLEDSPQIAAHITNIQYRATTFRVDILESDTLTYNPERFTDRDHLRSEQVVFVHNQVLEEEFRRQHSSLSVDVQPMSETERIGMPSLLPGGYVRITAATEALEAFKAIAFEYRRKKNAAHELSKGRPSSTYRISARKVLTAPQKYLRKALAVNPGAIVLCDLWPDGAAVSDEALAALQRVATLLRNQVDDEGRQTPRQVIIDYRISSAEDLAVMHVRLAAVLEKGVAGVRIIVTDGAKISESNLTTALQRLHDKMISMKNAPQLWFADNGSFHDIYHKPWVRRSVIIGPDTATLQNIHDSAGVWLDVNLAAEEYTGQWRDLQQFLLEFLQSAGAADMIGVDDDLVDEGCALLRSIGTGDFTAFVRDMFDLHAEDLLQTNPLRRRDHEFRKVMDREGFTALTQEQLRAVSSCLNNGDSAQLLAHVPAIGLDDDLREALAAVNLQESQEQSEIAVLASAVRGNFEASIARTLLSQYVDEVNRPIRASEDRIRYAKVLAAAYINGITVMPDDWLSLNHADQQQWFAQNRWSSVYENSEYAREAHAVNQILEREPFGPHSKRLAACMNNLQNSIDTLEEAGKAPLKSEIAELMRLMTLYLDREERSLRMIRKAVVDQLPAVKAMNASA